jgi:hypothetical protein
VLARGEDGGLISSWETWTEEFEVLRSESLGAEVSKVVAAASGEVTMAMGNLNRRLEGIDPIPLGQELGGSDGRGSCCRCKLQLSPTTGGANWTCECGFSTGADWCEITADSCAPAGECP